MEVSDFGPRRLASLGVAAGSASAVGTEKSAGDPAGGEGMVAQVATVVSRLGAVQAQDYPGTVWSLGLRVPGSVEADIEAAVEAARIVRTWPMRGTLHFVAADDLRWMVRLLTPRVIAGTRARQVNLELDAAQFAASQDTMRRALSGGQVLSREALLAAVQADGISTAGGRGYHFLFRAAMDLVICVGPTRDKEQTFALLDDWVPPSLDCGLEGEAAVAELAWRYFSSHGPVVVKDFAGWAGLNMTEAKAGLVANRQRLESEKIDGVEYWWAAADGACTGQPAVAGNGTEATALTKGTVKAKQATPGGRSDDNQSVPVQLLSGFDEFILGYKDRDPVLDPAFAERI